MPWSIYHATGVTPAMALKLIDKGSQYATAIEPGRMDLKTHGMDSGMDWPMPDQTTEDEWKEWNDRMDN